MTIIHNLSSVVTTDSNGNKVLRVVGLDFKIENPNISVELDAAEDSVECIQDTHDDLNANANVQVGDTDVDNTNPVPTKLQTINNSYNFTGVGVLGSFDTSNREKIALTVENTNSTNVVAVKGRLTGGTYETIWNIIGDIPVKSMDVCKWDEVEIEVTTYDATTSGDVIVSAFDSNFEDTFSNVTLTFTEGGIDYTAKTKEPTADQSHPVWQVKREYTSNSVTYEQFANCGYFTEDLSNKENIFPPAPLINNKSYLLDGVDEHVVIPANAAIDFDANSQPFSFSCWAKRPAGIVTGTLFGNFIFAQAPAIPGVGLFGTLTGMSIFLNNDNGAGNQINISHVIGGVADTWHHYCVTVDGSGTAAGALLYFDGALVTPAFTVDNLSASTANGNAWAAGAIATDFPLFPFNGNIDEWAVWDIELSAADVTELYNDGKPSDTLKHSKAIANPSDLLLYYRCGDDAADVFPTAANLGSLGAATDGTMTNMEAADIVDDVP